MPSLIDSSLWVDFTRARSPVALKQFIAPYIVSADAALAEPIAFEVLRHATDVETRAITAQFQTMPLLSTPRTLWDDAAKLGRACRKAGINAGSVDLLIVIVAMDHSAELVTFNRNFQQIATVCNLQLNLLKRPGT
jgi:predicted nucleic acid-binding protein